MQKPSPRHEWIDATRWHILNALADDWESPEQISRYFRDPARMPIDSQKLADLLEELFTRKYLFLTLNIVFEKTAVLAELQGRTDIRRIWLGRQSSDILRGSNCKRSISPTPMTRVASNQAMQTTAGRLENFEGEIRK